VGESRARLSKCCSRSISSPGLRWPHPGAPIGQKPSMEVQQARTVTVRLLAIWQRTWSGPMGLAGLNSCRHAVGVRPMTEPISSNSRSKVLRSRNTTRSNGDSRSKTTRLASASISIAFGPCALSARNMSASGCRSLFQQRGIPWCLRKSCRFPSSKSESASHLII
jgi:hypothetical protein